MMERYDFSQIVNIWKWSKAFSKLFLQAGVDLNNTFWDINIAMSSILYTSVNKPTSKMSLRFWSLSEST